MRFLFLILALLPSLSWAINITSHQFTAIPCAEDGNRELEFPSGADTCVPVPAADYVESFEGFDLSSSARAALDAATYIRIFATSKTVAEESDAYQIVSAECRDADGQSLLIKNDASIGAGGDSNKRRVELTLADSLSGYSNIPEGTNVWVGFSMQIPSANWPTGTAAGGSTKQVIAGQFYTAAGPALIMQFQHDGDSDGLVRFNFRRGSGAAEASPNPWKEYYYKKSIDAGNTGDVESGITNTTTSTADEFPLGVWVDIVINFVQDNAAATGSLDVWVIDRTDDTITRMISETNVQIGYADQEGLGLAFKDGLYFSGTGSDNRAPFVYKTYFDAFRMFTGTDGYGVVVPSGTVCP